MRKGIVNAGVGLVRRSCRECDGATGSGAKNPSCGCARGSTTHYAWPGEVQPNDCASHSRHTRIGNLVSARRGRPHVQSRLKSGSTSDFSIGERHRRARRAPAQPQYLAQQNGGFYQLTVRRASGVRRDDSGVASLGRGVPVVIAPRRKAAVSVASAHARELRSD